MLHCYQALRLWHHLSVHLVQGQGALGANLLNAMFPNPRSHEPGPGPEHNALLVRAGLSYDTPQPWSLAARFSS